MAAWWYLYRAFIMIHPLKTQTNKKRSSTKKNNILSTKKRKTSPRFFPKKKLSLPRSRKLSREAEACPFFVAGWPGPPLRLGVLPRFENREVGWTLDTGWFFVGWVGHVMFCISVGPWKTSAVQPVSFRLLSKRLVEGNLITGNEYIRLSHVILTY